MFNTNHKFNIHCNPLIELCGKCCFVVAVVGSLVHRHIGTVVAAIGTQIDFNYHLITRMSLRHLHTACSAFSTYAICTFSYLCCIITFPLHNAHLQLPPTPTRSMHGQIIATFAFNYYYPVRFPFFSLYFFFSVAFLQITLALVPTSMACLSHTINTFVCARATFHFSI